MMIFFDYGRYQVKELYICENIVIWVGRKVFRDMWLCGMIVIVIIQFWENDQCEKGFKVSGNVVVNEKYILEMKYKYFIIKN